MGGPAFAVALAIVGGGMDGGISARLFDPDWS